MKKNLLWMLAAILISSLTAVSMSSCSKDDEKDNEREQKTPTLVGMRAKYYVKANPLTVFDACDVTVEYTGNNGQTQTRTLTTATAEFTSDVVTINGLPNTAQLKVVITPKENITTEKYDIDLTYGVGGVAFNDQGTNTGAIKIVTNHVGMIGRMAENKTPVTRTKTITILADGTIQQ